MERELGRKIRQKNKQWYKWVIEWLRRREILVCKLENKRRKVRPLPKRERVQRVRPLLRFYCKLKGTEVVIANVQISQVRCRIHYDCVTLHNFCSHIIRKNYICCKLHFKSSVFIILTHYIWNEIKFHIVSLWYKYFALSSFDGLNPIISFYESFLVSN